MLTVSFILPSHIQKNKLIDNNTSTNLAIEKIETFEQLKLSPSILSAIDKIGFDKPTEIQAAVIPMALQKKDIVGIARTGTGKTVSFTLPILEMLSQSNGRARMPRALILEPTRELALQVADNLKLYNKYVKFSHSLLVGGESQSEQKENLRRGTDIIIATPGRLIDLFGQGAILLNQIQILVIDEADRMLDMGFIPDIEKIVSYLPQQKQTLLLSATMPPEIKRLTNSFLVDPIEISISPPSSVASTIESKVIIVPDNKKRKILRTLLQQENVKNAIIFCNRKKDVDILTRSLKKHDFKSASLHGDIAQHHRTQTMEDFKNGKIQFLVCSDIAARGIDVENLTHVFNFDIPLQPEDYVHRIGRTGRAEKTGYAYSLATLEEKELIVNIEKLINETIPVLDINDFMNTSKETDNSTDKKLVKNKNSRQQKTKSRKADNKNLIEVAPRIPLTHALIDNDTPVIGFGQFVPAFMLSPFRKL